MKKILAGIIGVSVLVSCNSTQKQENVAPKLASSPEKVLLNPEQLKNGGITLGIPKEEVIGATIKVNGRVEVPPQNKAAITFPYGGFVKKVVVLDGMQVKKGQVLISLEDPSIIQLQQDYLENFSQLDYLKADYERQKSLNAQEVNSAKTFQMAKSAYFTAQARLKGMKAKLELAGVSVSRLESGTIQREVNITAPFNGIVTKMNAEVGKYANPQDVLMELIDLQHCHIEAFVFEKDISSIRIGQEVHVWVGTQSEEVKAKVFLIGKEIGPDKTIKVHLHLVKEDEALIPGTYVQARIDLSGSRHLVVPEDAIVQFHGKDVIFESTAKTDQFSSFRMIPVEILGEEAGKVAIRPVDGKITKPVVLSGAYSVLSVLTIGSGEEE